MTRTLPDFHTPSFVVRNISLKNVDVLGIRLKPGRTSDLFVDVPGMTEEKIIKATSRPNGTIYGEAIIKGTLEISRSSLSTFQFDPDGIFDSITLSMPQWDDLRVPITAVTGSGGVKQPGFGQVLDDGGASTGVFAYLYDPNAEEELFFTVQMPHSWLEGSAIRPHIHWMPMDGNAGNVEWGLEYSKVSPGGTFGNTTTLPVIDAADGTAKKHQIASFAPIDMTGDTVSTMILCRIFRDATDVVNDTYGAEAAALEIDFHYQINTFGSRQEYIK
jgi:hypothetical protein